MNAPGRDGVVIAGGGLAGALMAIFLGRRGIPVTVYERRPDPREETTGRGRSINLAISTRGLAALERVGLKRRALEMAVPMRGRMIHDTTGHLSFQPYGSDPGHVINSISRNGLNCLLLEEAERLDNVQLRFRHRCTAVNAEKAEMAIEQPDGTRLTRHGTLIGADGAFSAVRAHLMRRERFDYQQSWLDYGYKELHIPPAAGGGFRMEPNALHIWPRERFMMIALPNDDGSFTCTLFWPLAGDLGFDNLRDGTAVLAHFQRWFPDAVPLMPDLARDYLAVAPSSLVTIRCWPWSVGGNVTLIGDACHAVVPFYGQGMNAAFEDCLVLDECIEAHLPEWERVFATYQSARKPNTDALAELALENFVEMRDHVASPWFRLRKRLGNGLHRLMPKTFVPLYSLVTFTTVPYAEARRRATRQARTMRFALGVIALLAAWIVMEVVS